MVCSNEGLLLSLPLSHRLHHLEGNFPLLWMSEEKGEKVLAFKRKKNTDHNKQKNVKKLDSNATVLNAESFLRYSNSEP